MAEYAWDHGVHFSNLAANASRYEVGSSKPDDATLRAVWIIWAACAGLSTLLASTVATAILASGKARGSVFNLYLACLLSVEAFNGLNVIITCLLNVAHGTFISEAMCEWQAWYMSFAASSAFYLNLLIAHEVFKLLSATKRIDPYTPPTQRVAMLRCFGVMLPCALISSMGAWRVLPHRARLMRGLICFPSGSNEIGQLSLIFLPVMFPLCVFLPTVLSCSLALVSWRRKLFDFGIRHTVLPSDSNDLHARAAHRHRLQQARMITLFFSRIFVVVLLWYPAFLSTAIPFYSPMFTAIGLPFVFLQSAVSACMSLTKTDVREAVVDLLSSGLFHMCRRPSRVAAWQSQPHAQQAGFKPAKLPSTRQLGSSAPRSIQS
jgi:hypothetical protein